MASERIYISVVLPLRLDWDPYYYIEAEDASVVKVGSRVKVSFAFKVYDGVVTGVGLSPLIDESKIMPVLEVSQQLDLVSENELRLWSFISEYYMCTKGEVYKAAYPSGKISEEQISARILMRKEASLKKKTDASRAKISKLEDRLARLQEKLKVSVKQSVADSLKEKIALVQASLDQEQSVLESLLKQDIRLDSDLDTPMSGQSDTLPVLSPAQNEALDKIHKAFADSKTVLLEGVTGSGKTELYMTLAAETIRSGKSVLYLVPEIAISRQIEERLESVFGNLLLTFHSGETMIRRREVASQIKRCRQYVVLGTRSSLFLPHHDLGLVIIDEEQDSSYKQTSPAPRYNGRDTAIFLGSIFGANVLLGTATPSLESIYNTACGKWAKVSLTERYHGSADPDVEIVDTIAERRKNGMEGSFSRKLIQRMTTTLSCGEQILLLRARRAYSPIVQCDNCGFVPKCPHCNVTLSYHRDINSMVCHHCGFSGLYDEKCPSCGTGNLVPLGAGTQRIEEEVKALFPDATVARLDGDTALRKNEQLSTIRSFASGKTDILIGTQIVAKGFDFKGLTLVAAIQADSLAGQEDFRADEKAVQTLEQFKGRCGRRDKKGLFVIQTSRPDHPVYKHLTGQNDDVATMLPERRQFCYPPYFRLVNIILKDSYHARLEQKSLALAAQIRKSFGTAQSFLASPDGAAVQVVGPFAPVVDKVADEYIKIIRIHVRRDKSLSDNKKRLAWVIDDFQKKASWEGHVAIDVDPV